MSVAKFNDSIKLPPTPGNPEYHMLQRQKLSTRIEELEQRIKKLEDIIFKNE